jgi:uncharacterized protein (UPF0335 family)
MAQSNDLLKGTAIGIGLTVLVPVALTIIVPIVRPMVRAAVKAGVGAYERSREVVEEFGEAVDDVRAEVQQELFDVRQTKEGVKVPKKASATRAKAPR